MASTYDHSPITGNQVRIIHTIRTLAQQRYSIVLTSQVPDHAFLVCNQVALLTSGRLHRPGSPQEIITDQTLSKLYDTAMRVLHVQLLECPAADLSLCVALMTGVGLSSQWKYQCVFAPHLAQLPPMRQPNRAPNIEAILLAKPDVVLTMHRASIDLLAHNGIPNMHYSRIWI
jgi:hypothetical protein